MPDKIFEVDEGGLSDGHPFIFLFGNPTRSSGKLYRVCFGSEQEGWVHRSIDSRETVTSIIGVTELADDRLFSAAAVFHLDRVAGLYRKLHPAIRRSVYSAGTQTPVFRVDGITLGIVICNDSTFSEPAKAIAVQGATALFIPTNNGLP